MAAFFSAAATYVESLPIPCCTLIRFGNAFCPVLAAFLPATCPSPCPCCTLICVGIALCPQSFFPCRPCLVTPNSLLHPHLSGRCFLAPVLVAFLPATSTICCTFIRLGNAFFPVWAAFLPATITPFFAPAFFACQLFLVAGRGGWRVPKYPPGEKSICCQKFGDVVGPGGWDGTLRWGPKAPKCLVHRDGNHP